MFDNLYGDVRRTTPSIAVRLWGSLGISHELLGTYGYFTPDTGRRWWSLMGTSTTLKSLGIGWKIVGAGDGNRTRMASLEGWSSTIELHPRV